MRQIILSLALIAPAAPALAHPHMFMDTSLQVMLDGSGAVASVQITWVYDDLSSLQYIADLGLDMDGDGVLTADEKAVLSGFDMNWDAGFAGDSYALLGGVDLGLSRPRAFSADYLGGKIVSTHVRDLSAPVPLSAGQEMIVQVYDPGFYAAYTIREAAISFAGAPRACTAQMFEPDRSAADEALLAALAEYAADEDIEADFPAIGAAYAEEVRVSCAD
jgi:polyphosphate kinase